MVGHFTASETGGRGTTRREWNPRWRAVSIRGRSCLGLATAALLAGLAVGHPASAPGPLPPGVRALEAPGIHNLFALGTNVFSGSAPEGEAAFAALKELGVRTIVTVDGATPDVELARQHGLRYVHLPHGYDGIRTNRQVELVKAGQSLPGPVFVHCHHGKHRGPTAAAVMCLANQGWTPAQAEAWLVAAGTATNYAGLYATVRGFNPPTAEQLRAVPVDFPETARVSGLVEAMVDIDEQWEHLKAVRAADYAAPGAHPDIQPANEAVILWERYRETQRQPESVRHGEDFIGRLRAAETRVREVERLLRQWAAEPGPALRAALDRAFDGAAKDCSACHQAYRDPAGVGAKR